MNVVGVIISGAVALVITVALTAVVRGLAPVIAAKGGRRGPRRTVGAGVAVVLATTGVMVAAPRLGLPEPGAGVRFLLAASAAVAVLGLVKEVRPVGARTELVLRTVLAALVAAFSGLSPVAAVGGAVLMVLLTHALQLLEGSDGTAAGVTVVLAAGLLACAAVDHHPGAVLLLAVAGASVLGVMPYNWPPARVYYGSCGSQYTGFLLSGAALLVLSEAPDGSAAWVSVPVLMTMTLADLVLVLLSRKKAGRSFLAEAQDHAVHRLRRLRLTPRGAAVTMILTTAACASTGTLIHTGVIHPAVGLAVPAAAALAVLALLRVPVHSAPAPRTGVRRKPVKDAAAPQTAAGTPSRRAASVPGPAQQLSTPGRKAAATPSRASTAPHIAATRKSSEGRPSDLAGDRR
ncbi:undecaprenyl/decaprenyl-phosphate alpha-N-acetylglucosaminyl 1-phosphate transferase [Streptomyces sp. NBC_01218]|uniref:undecaprenyl/decaprenyl-phosphate alpha-N-acetylglucosaminyl 1-phosphate transferase n=1 Tax=Streptomyces sp. NBC_01218 TaxID=2903780 RepID=UPI002E163474|nr:undecaprenyl/decaprenyl-phosphate alpha-N-acetylglucosaminyl 1-phosphate transferase [Streptomyces sp. NBC_01218]